MSAKWYSDPPKEIAEPGTELMILVHGVCGPEFMVARRQHDGSVVMVDRKGRDGCNWPRDGSLRWTYLPEPPK